MKTRLFAAFAIAGVAAASLAGCASGGGAGESPTATAEALLTALAEGNVESVQALSGLEADDPMLSLLPQATERISEIEMRTSDPENLDGLTEVDVEVAYTLGGERYEDSLRVKKEGTEEEQTWIASVPTGSARVTSKSAFSVGDAEAASVWTLLPGTYPVSMDVPYVNLDATEVVVGSGDGVEAVVPASLNEETFLPAAQAATAEAIAMCLSSYDPNRTTPDCGGAYGDVRISDNKSTFSVQGDIPALSVASGSDGGEQVSFVDLAAGETVTILKESSSSMSNFGIDNSSSQTITAALTVKINLLPEGTEFQSISITG